MRRRIFEFALLCIACVIPVTPRLCALHKPHALKRRDYRREIQDLEQQWRAAQLAGDAATMDRLLSDDYVGITINGMTNTKTQQLDRVRGKSLIVTRMDLSDIRIKVVGTVAIVTGQAEVAGTNEETALDGIVRYTRVYQRTTSGSWKITNFEVTRIPSPNDRPSN